ncbi:MAG: multidrug ABC transporter permease [Phycisphaerales bacterium]|nr:MAG: multidrug ABC transporter permease [Phycisphaerales bacterium]
MTTHAPHRVGTPAILALWRRELTRVVRQPTRLIAALATPLLLWLVLASGFADSIAPPVRTDDAEPALGYAAFLLPGIITLTVTFTSIFGAISLIEDRHRGLLQGVLASPAPAWAIAGSKLLGAATVATAQGAILLLAAYAVGMRPGPTELALALAGVLLVSLGIGGVALAAAWWVDSVQGFHSVMNLVLMPMWLLSGSAFPIDGAAGWMGAVMRANPLAWATGAVRAALLGEFPALPWLGGLAFAALGVGLAILTIGRRTRRPHRAGVRTRTADGG